MEIDLSQEALDEFWAQEGKIVADIVRKLGAVETWTTPPPDGADEALHLFIREAQLFNIDGEDRESLEAILVLLAYIPVEKAIYYISHLSELDVFADLMRIVQESPPLKDFAKVMQSRLVHLQQQQLRLEIYSAENRAILTSALEAIKNEKQAFSRRWK